MELLQLWQSVYQEAVQLADFVERLPDACGCGDADAHLDGRCRCCSGHEQTGEHHGGGENCTAVLTRLRADLTMLSRDFAIAGPPMEGSALEEQRFELRRGVFLAANDLQQILEAFKRVTESVAGFRSDCAIPRMRAVKRNCAELRKHCERVNADMQASK
ncbi:MAG TPA: hypothetical protein VLE20_04680 [Blastocatellia bacterium]|nr:hypothetical protein [Blastocatellia bacterium]